MTAPAEPTLFVRLHQQLDRLAVIDDEGRATYQELLEGAAQVAAALLGNRSSLQGARVVLDIRPGRHWVMGLLGIWRAGGFAVPVALAFPAGEIAYTLDDAGAQQAVADAAQAPRLRELCSARNISVVEIEKVLPWGTTNRTDPTDRTDPPDSPIASSQLPPVALGDPALLIYTSGTTGRPKGVVLTHANLEAQMACLEQAWGWSPDDHIVSVLPLHHVHGIVNVTLCALWAGARLRVLPAFDAENVWATFRDEKPTLFMAVPTIYRRLIETWESADAEKQQAWQKAAADLRLMVSGSAALPLPTFERWRQITGHTLLERYGMSEIGMALSSPLDGERRPGTVGQPLPGVAVRRVDGDGQVLRLDAEPGELEIQGPSVFREYWRRDEATREAFRDDGFFRTGDVAVVENGYYRLLGRSSVDILKTGGEKVSALEIEDTLREHPAIRDLAIVGLPDETWGQKIAAAVELKEGFQLDLEELRAWAKERLASYKVPRQLLIVECLPRNPLGKVQKPRVAELFS